MLCHHSPKIFSQLRYPYKPRIKRLQLLLRNLQRQVAPINQTKLHGQLCDLSEYLHLDRATKRPTLPGPVWPPRVVDEPPWDANEECNDEKADEEDNLGGLP